MIKIDETTRKEITAYNTYREESCLSKYACKSTNAKRLLENSESIPDIVNIRPAYFHDTDRIIHSSAYTRYIDKTQVFFLFENDLITHRVLHVQFVSKIARVIGRCLNLNEDLIEAISLAHDLGHVPFGHDGEKYLNKIFYKNTEQYFCHNAQSVRCLMNLEKKGVGLNLSIQVLDGILCHNGELLKKKYLPDYAKTQDILLDEYDKCWKVENFSKKIMPMTLEGCVVRISDVIAYIGRDIEDAIILNILKREDIPEQITKIIGNTNDNIINNLALDIINNSFNKDHLSFSEEIFETLSELLDFNNKNIYQNQQKMTQNAKIEFMFTYLYDSYKSDLVNKNINSSIINWYDSMSDKYKDNNSIDHIVLDYIAGMTDDYFNSEFNNKIIPKSFGYGF